MGLLHTAILGYLCRSRPSVIGTAAALLVFDSQVESADGRPMSCLTGLVENFNRIASSLAFGRPRNRVILEAVAGGVYKRVAQIFVGR